MQIAATETMALQTGIIQMVGKFIAIQVIKNALYKLAMLALLIDSIMH